MYMQRQLVLICGAFALFRFQALGGDWTGPVNASTPFPQVMKVDYVRACKLAH